MKNFLFPFYKQEKHSFLFLKKWFKFVLIIFPILVIFVTFKITMIFADNMYLYCYDELSRGQSQQTLDAARKINNLDFNDPKSELKTLQIQQESITWFKNEINKCRSLADKYSSYVIPFGISILIISYYLIQVVFFSFIKKLSVKSGKIHKQRKDIM